jgi:hypothetical protein
MDLSIWQLKVTDLPSFVTMFATSPTARASCPILSRVISMLGTAVPKGILVEAYFIFSTKTDIILF